MAQLKGSRNRLLRRYRNQGLRELRCIMATTQRQLLGQILTCYAINDSERTNK